MERVERRQDDELARPAAILAQRFVQRWDAYARQLDDGSYVCVHKQLNVEHLYAHLCGEITLGTYVLNQSSQARFVVLDDDRENGWSYLLDFGAKLAADGIPAYLEKSRRGGHLWMFFEQPLAGAKVRSFAQAVVKKHDFDGFEIYPKQGKSDRGLGSLIRMPFGVHRLVGRRYGFFAADGRPLGRTLREQMYALQSPQFVPEALLKTQTSISSAREPNARPTRLREPTEHLSEKLKVQVTVMDFVGQYVELRPTQNGAVGLCPFHDDHRPSFGVNAEENYWHCFAGCGGGSIIDFWLRWRKQQGLDPSFRATLSDLAAILFGAQGTGVT
ncbi:MAG TPA: CHC2 zinc finger domain-containing protein [Anaerolineae bacterium]|nr:CHC2 zinc finger domain-containing protein [Anaerolineae bacterium]